MGSSVKDGSEHSGSDQTGDHVGDHSIGSGRRVRFEDILKMVGENGRWQIVIFLFTWIEGMLIGMHHLSSTFLGASMDHWCNTSHMAVLQDLGWTKDQIKQFAIPMDGDKPDSCHMYNLTELGSIDRNFESALKSRPEDLGHVSCEMPGIPERESWEYDQTEGIKSIVNDWDLVCERLPLLSTIQASYMGGVFVGCVVFGWASDRFGRRPTMLVAGLIQAIASVCAAFCTSYMTFVFFRFLVAFSVSGVFECGFVLVTELCGPKFRAPFGILTQFPFGIGAAILPLIAYFIRDWDTLQLAISIPCSLLVTYYWFVPESPRWLVSAGRFEEALKILKEGAKQNGNTLPSDQEILDLMERIKSQEEVVEHETEDKTTGEKVREIFKEIISLVETPEMRKRTLNVFFSWLVVAMVYYGLSFNTKNLGGNRYVSVFVSGFVEVPAVVVILPALATLGRVKCYCGTFILSGVCCVLVAVITLTFEVEKIIWLPVTIAMIGKFLISMTFAIAYLYTAELFPTNVRNVAVGAASTFARIGSMSAPYIVDLLGAIHASIPVIIFGIVSAIAGLCALMLPETLNRKMPESVTEIEEAAKRKKLGKVTEEEMNAVNQSPDDSNRVEEA